MVRLIALGAASAAAFAFAACSPDEEDFKREGEEFLESDDVTENFGSQVTDVECQEPESKNVGTTYTCTGTADGQEYVFTIEITGERELLVTDAQPAG